MTSVMNTISLVPFDGNCRLLSNLLWSHDQRDVATLSRQHLWARFPHAVHLTGIRFLSAMALGQVRFETSEDEGRSWKIIAETMVQENSKEIALDWECCLTDNLRIVVAEPPNAVFPFMDYFLRAEAVCDGETTWADSSEIPQTVFLTNRKFDPHQPLGGDPTQNIFDRLGHCHLPIESNRLDVSLTETTVAMTSSLLHLTFSRDFALIRSLGWDTGGRGRESRNLLSSSNTQGAFPIVGRGIRRLTSDSAGGVLEGKGRSLTYRDIRVVPELREDLEFIVREDGFSLKITWVCEKSFRTHEFAVLRLPFDLYQSVTNVLALPNTTGPSGLVNMPLLIHAPNHGTMRVTVCQKRTDLPILARISPFRAYGELWLDLIVGAVPLDNGLFEIPEGEGCVTLDFNLTKIFPLAETDIFNRWQWPPSYSFVDRENILGALPNEWLSGMCFRPELGRFANNSVSESAALCASFYADIAAYTPPLAPGLAATDLLKFATDSVLLDRSHSTFTDYHAFPQAAGAPLDCAWLTIAATGDWDWAQTRKAELMARAEILLGMEHEKTGLAAAKPTGYGTASWFDSFRSTHLESYVNAHLYRTTLRTADILERLGENQLPQQLRDKAARTRENFMRIFFSPQTRRLAQWVDPQGNSHGFDSHAHLGSAIVCGLIDTDLARQLLQEFLGRLKDKGFTAFQYGLPIVLDPIPSELHNDWMGKGVECDGSDAVGTYMNGAVTHLQCYWILQALYRCGLRTQANDLFMRLTPLARSGGISGGLHSGLDWKREDGSPSGYEGLLAEQHHFLLAAITGYLGLTLTLDGPIVEPSVTSLCSDRLKKLHPNFAQWRNRELVNDNKKR